MDLARNMTRATKSSICSSGPTVALMADIENDFVFIIFEGEK
jgi:hypothetical protein